MKAALLVLFALLGGCAWQPRGPLPMLLTFSDGTCSGTAIAPHAVLTATHCFENGIVKLPKLIVRNRIDDGNDHTLLIVGETFPVQAIIAPMPDVGTTVHIFGNPAELRGLYADGTVAGEYKGDTLLNLPIFYGDSGAAVLDADGRIVGMISGLRILSGGKAFVQWGEARPFNFTAAQWREAGL